MTEGAHLETRSPIQFSVLRQYNYVYNIELVSSLWTLKENNGG